MTDDRHEEVKGLKQLCCRLSGLGSNKLDVIRLQNEIMIIRPDYIFFNLSLD